MIGIDLLQRQMKEHGDLLWTEVFLCETAVRSSDLRAMINALVHPVGRSFRIKFHGPASHLRRTCQKLEKLESGEINHFDELIWIHTNRSRQSLETVRLQGCDFELEQSCSEVQNAVH